MALETPAGAAPPRKAAETAAGRGEVFAVLTADVGPYREALEGFREAWGGEVLRLPLDGGLELPASAKVVVAFGGKAAGLRYPARLRVVTVLSSTGDPRNAVAVQMIPGPERLARLLLEFHPALQRVELVWASDAMLDYAVALREAAAALGFQARGTLWSKGDDLGEHLDRVLAQAGAGQVEAVWVFPEPELITRANLQSAAKTCAARGVPLLTPLPALARYGTAAVGSSYADMGRAAAQAARALLAGRPVPPKVYPAGTAVVPNPKPAAGFGLEHATATFRPAEARPR